MITEEEFKGWLMDPTTQVIMRDLPQAKIKELQRLWSAGNFNSANLDETAILNHTNVAIGGMWQYVLNLTYQDVKDALQGDQDE